MSNYKPFVTYHDLSSTEIIVGHKIDPDAAIDEPTSEHLQDNVYEQLAELDYIYVDRPTVDSSNFALSQGPTSLADVFEGLAQLATMGVVEVTDIVEAIHREIILRPIGRLNERSLKKWPRGITGRIYGTVRYIATFVGNNLTTGLWLYNNMTKHKNVQRLPRSLRRLINILNGVMGDHLVTHKNALAIPMVLYDKYNYLQSGELSGRIIILCHGLCMSHLSWNIPEHDSLGETLIRSQPTSTILYLNYNTGRRISSNGRSFSKLLQSLVDNNPDIAQIDLVGHSMGGLVSRSALFYGKEQGYHWVQRVGNLITLGSPHNGASLERIGVFVQEMIGKLPFAGSLAKLGDLRSAGIIDLRYGSVRDADWNTLEGRSVLPQEFRHPARLPLHVRSYFVAGTIVEAHYDSKAASLLGDGLVTVNSALGEDSAEHTLFVPEGHKAVFYGVNHYDLIYNERVHAQVKAWLLDNGRSDTNQMFHVLRTRIYSYPNDLDVVV